MEPVIDVPLIHGEGTRAAQWPPWLEASGLPVLPSPPRTRRLVVVAPHPDDEVLMCGGLLRRHVAQDAEVLVIAVTDGEASHEGLPEWAPHRLGRLRRAESAAGLTALGLKESQVQRLHLPDGQLQQHAGDLQAKLQNLLRPTDDVVTTWRRDGHPDHDGAGACVARVCTGLGCRLLEAPVWMWHWAHPLQEGIPWHRLHTFALDEDAKEHKQAALACHVSQLTPRSTTLGAVLEQNILARSAWRHEYFFVTEASA